MLSEEDFIYLPITQDMYDYAKSLEKEFQMNRTIENEYQTMTGLLGEMIFAKWWYGDWMKGNRPEDLKNNFGKSDFPEGIEVKASSHKFDWRLNLLVRKDYNDKRIPRFYVQVLFPKEPQVDGDAILIGYVNGENAHEGEIRTPRGTSFECCHTSFRDLHPMEDLRVFCS